MCITKGLYYYIPKLIDKISLTFLSSWPLMKEICWMASLGHSLMGNLKSAEGPWSYCLDLPSQTSLGDNFVFLATEALNL